MSIAKAQVKKDLRSKNAADADATIEAVIAAATQDTMAAQLATANASPNAELPADLDKLRSAILSDLTLSMDALLKKALDNALAPLTVSLEQVKSSFSSQETRIQGVEDGLSSYSDRLEALENLCAKLLAENKVMKEKMDDFDNRARRGNLRVVGIPENLEGSDPVKFMTEFFEEVMGKDFFQHPLVLTRAHRVGRKFATGSSGSQRSRMFLVCFHYFQDKHRISTRKRQQLYFRGHPVVFHEDVSPDLGQKQAAFKEVKSLLYEKKVRFALIYPARLRVTHDGETLFFDSAAEAREFYELHWGKGPRPARRTPLP